MLMIGFIARVSRGSFRLSAEVDGAEWVPASKALAMVHPPGSVSYALVSAFLEEES